ncbi:hypothetical protein R3P38DRAFT_2891109 [Favolaschia claudopus]|uniref:Uncharacterized protein n=1 Tax=Favolaschia claudopus TaxID=2862362 RepID=A0AAW0CX36_9AGAR
MATVQWVSIPISVEPRRQRTLKIVGFGLKAVFTSKIPGRLVLFRTKAHDTEIHCDLLNSPSETHAVPDPVKPEQAVSIVVLPTVFPEDIHADVVSRGIKVRDFAYPATRIGHSNPTHPHSMETAKNPKETINEAKNEDLPDSPENAPMPSVFMTWQPPHPALRPIPRPPLLPCSTPNQFVPVYPTHRIPVEFHVLSAIAQVHTRLAETPRTVPIRGTTTRRLLTLGPGLVDLSQYHEMDLEELRRYDRLIIWSLMHGIDPYPWYPDCYPGWVPGPKTLAYVKSQGEAVARIDLARQRELLIYGYRQRMEDDAWLAQEMQKAKRENAANGFVYTGKKSYGLDAFDRIFSRQGGVTLRQYLTLWERRMESDQASPQYAKTLGKLKQLRKFDRTLAAVDGCAGDEDEEMMPQPDPYEGVVAPFKLGQTNIDLPRLPFWGPDAVWDGYRSKGGVPTGKTINEYAAELSKAVDDGSAWPPPPDLKRKFDALDGDSGSEGGEDEIENGVDDRPEATHNGEREAEEGPSRKRVRRA